MKKIDYEDGTTALFPFLDDEIVPTAFDIFVAVDRFSGVVGFGGQRIRNKGAWAVIRKTIDTAFEIVDALEAKGGEKCITS